MIIKIINNLIGKNLIGKNQKINQCQKLIIKYFIFYFKNLSFK